MFEFFAHPALLGGAAAGAIPIIIHLLNRQRFKRVIWGAMHWLWASFKKSQRRLQIEQILLLLIRVLILVLLAFAIARPALQEGIGLLTGRTSLHRVIVIDNSYSMGQLSGGRPLLEKAKDRAIELTGKLSAGDSADVILANTSFEELTASSTAAKSEIVKQIKAVKLSDGGTDIPRAIAAACRLLNERRAGDVRKEIILLTDQTRAGWEQGGQPKRVSGDDEAAVQKQFSGKSKPRIVVMRLAGEKDPDNLAALRVDVDEKVISARTEAQFTGSVVNFSSGVKSAKVKLKIDGEDAATEFIPGIAPGPLRPETVTFRHTFAEAGSHVVSIELEGDVLPADNTAFLAVDVEEQTRVLCVDGEQRTGPQGSEMDYFRQALQPAKSEEVNAGRMPLAPEVISDAVFAEANLDNYRLVVLGNVAFIPPEKIQALERFVRGGGALLIFLGGRTDPAIYNRDWANLLPAPLGELTGTGEPDGPADSLSDKETSHPAIEKFKGIKGWSLGHLRTYRRFRLAVKQPPEPGVRTVLSYENGEPAAVEKMIGEGRVVLVGTTADQAWNNWPVTSRYMPLMNFIALDLIQPACVQRNRFVGDRFSIQVPRQDLGAARREGIRLIDPAGESSNMEVLMEQSRAESGAIKRAGAYFAHLPGGAQRTLYFAANRGIEESDLAQIENREILAHIPREDTQAGQPGYFNSLVTQADVDLLTEEVKDAENHLKKHAGSREIWRWLAGTVLALVLVESVLARRFGDFSR